MYETLLRNLVPMMIVKVGTVSQDDKRRYAQFLLDLCAAYLDNRRVDFARLLDQAQLPNGWVHSICGALWCEDKSQ